MTKRIMAVYDIDPLYADKFADFANRKEQVPFTVMAFTTLEKLRDYAGDHEVEILLISSMVPREEIDKVKAGQVVTLADGEMVAADGQYPSIYKYQATDSVIREVMTHYCEHPALQPLTLMTGEKHIIGVYSPVNRCLKTSFALTMGQLLSKETRTLYVNLEDCSGFSRLLETTFKGDLSDVIYFYRQGSYNFTRLGSVIYSWGGLDYIPPVRYPEDLCQMSPEDMADLLSKIARDSPYDTMIIDVGQFGRSAAGILDICNVIYMPVKDDGVSAAKVEEYLDYLEASGRGGLKERIKRLKLPYHSSFGRKENYMEQLIWGELGDYVRQLLKGRQPWGM